MTALMLHCCQSTNKILTFILGNTARMNSGELKVDVPLASMESDCEEANTDSVANTPSKNAASKGEN